MSRGADHGLASIRRIDNVTRWNQSYQKNPLIEKDPYDTTQKAKESQDTSHKIIELQKKLDSARTQIKRLPGIEYSKEEQLQKLETLRKQLRLKRELLLKYRNMCTFEIPKVQ